MVIICIYKQSSYLLLVLEDGLRKLRIEHDSNKDLGVKFVSFFR